MTNELEELESAYAKMGEKIAALKAKQEEAVWPTVWHGYWCINADGELRSYDWKNSKTDQNCLSIGNCFRTREEAEAERDARIVIAELKRQPGAKKLSNTYEDWGVVVRLRNNTVEHMYNLTNLPFGAAYFASEKSCRAAIKSVGEDRILKVARWLACGETK